MTELASTILNMSYMNVSSGVNAGLNKTDNGYTDYVLRPETYIIPVIFSLIFIVGVIGNGILILILLCNANMRNIPNIYVLSLALGDLLLIVTCVPFTSVLYTVPFWPWGLHICKLSEFVKDVSIGVSVFTLAALAAERYCAIVNPIRRHVAGLSAKPLTILTASLIWVLAIVLAIPDVIVSCVENRPIVGNVSILICTPYPLEFGNAYRKSLVMIKFLVYYAVPLCVIAGFYLGMARHLILSTRNMPGEMPDCDHHCEQIRARRRVGKMVLAFIIIFAICFLPYHIFMLWFHFSPTSEFDYNGFWHVLRMVGFCLSFSNSCVNPIALYFISGTFRQSFNKYLCCCLPGGYAAWRRDRTKSGRTRGDSNFSQRSRGGIRGTIYETSFGSTIRRQTQESNSTGILEMGNIEKKYNHRLIDFK